MPRHTRRWNGAGPAAGVLELEAREASKAYKADSVVVLDHVNLAVATGEWLSIVGTSGAGKSTLIHLLAGLDVPDAGQIFFRGEDLARYRHLSSYRRSEVGLVFQLHNLLPHLDARRNIEIAMFGSSHSPASRRSRASELLVQLGLSEQAGRKPPELSGGERQRVAIARALANRPRVLLADEPTGSLDPENVELVVAIFKQLHAGGTTIVMVTHDAAVAAESDRVVELRSGHLSTVGGELGIADQPA